MHRITVVTNSVSSDVLSSVPSSPVPALDAASDYSTGDEPSPNSLKASVSRPANISKWRKRGLRHIPSSDPEPIQLDMSLLQRQRLPIELLVDQPVPVENCYDDPDTQAFVDYFSNSTKSKRGSRRCKSRIRRKRCTTQRTRVERAVQEREESNPSPSSDSAITTSNNTKNTTNTNDNGENELELNFANFDLFDIQNAATIQGSPLEQPSKCSDGLTSAAESCKASPLLVGECGSQQDWGENLSKNSAGTALSSASRDKDKIMVVSPESLSIAAEETTTQTISTNDSTSQECLGKLQPEPIQEAEALVRCTSVIRMQYGGEMVSVSEQRANKIQECDWV